MGGALRGWPAGTAGSGEGARLASTAWGQRGLRPQRARPTLQPGPHSRAGAGLGATSWALAAQSRPPGLGARQTPHSACQPLRAGHLLLPHGSSQMLQLRTASRPAPQVLAQGRAATPGLHALGVTWGWRVHSQNGC